MRLGQPASAILAAVIFNAVIIVFLIPLALKGVKYRALGAAVSCVAIFWSMASGVFWCPLRELSLSTWAWNWPI